MLRLLLIRHGETDWNVENRSQGRQDIPLNDKGREQSALLGEYLKGEIFDAVYCSDLSRARDTARSFAKDVIEDARLQERDYGKWDGLTPEEASECDAMGREAYDRDPVLAASGGAETGIDIYMRAASFLSDVLQRHSSGNVAIVTHGGLGAALLATLLHGTPQTLACFRLLNCAVTEVTIREDGRRKLVRYNDDSFLTP